ncbi:putative tranposon-transfer assisting protein [Fusobacterium naviforme]|jgi:hypothetical protein|nr:hypothetical protein F7P78_11185 [Fusobacterium naviforme]PSL08702.1 putative tranposon-transfer assisting protein [Fusobacterium naviforme]STO41771.1 Uncharacterised protein [Fusobacterium naviforme]
MAFSIEERTLIKLYSDPENLSRDKVLENIRHSLPAVKDPEFIEQLNTIVRKVNALTEEAFQKIDLDDIIE